VQAALLVLDSSHQRAHLVGHEMVNLDRDPAAASLIHESCGLFNRLRPVHFRSLGSGRSPGDIDGRSGRTQLHSGPSSRSSGRSGDQCDFAYQRFLHGLSPMVLSCALEAAPHSTSDARRAPLQRRAPQSALRRQMFYHVPRGASSVLVRCKRELDDCDSHDPADRALLCV
jgi:hypothetical protein